jgi:hypothetical protein
VLEPTAAARAAGSSGAAFQGGAVCQLVSLSAAGNVSMFSVMLGAAAGGVAAESGMAATAADLGTRAGEMHLRHTMRTYRDVLPTAAAAAPTACCLGVKQ